MALALCRQCRQVWYWETSDSEQCKDYFILLLQLWGWHVVGRCLAQMGGMKEDVGPADAARQFRLYSLVDAEVAVTDLSLKASWRQIVLSSPAPITSPRCVRPFVRVPFLGTAPRHCSNMAPTLANAAVLGQAGEAGDGTRHEYVVTECPS